jgi:hypothetical protein
MGTVGLRKLEMGKSTLGCGRGVEKEAGVGEVTIWKK